MTTCHHCGQDMPSKHGWRGLMVTSLGDVFWRGTKKFHLTNVQTRLLTMLVGRGEATHMALEMAIAGTSNSLMSVHMTNIRRKLRAANVPVRILPVHGHGYRLEVADDTETAGA